MQNNINMVKMTYATVWKEFQICLLTVHYLWFYQYSNNKTRPFLCPLQLDYALNISQGYRGAYDSTKDLGQKYLRVKSFEWVNNSQNIW